MAERVYIADDEAMVRRFLKRALDHEGMLARAFEDGRMLLDAMDSLEPGVILLDVRMPNMDGLQVLEAMGARTRIHAVLMLSSHGDVSTAVRAIHAGAIDFIEKPFSMAPLLARIRHLHQMVMEWQGDHAAMDDANTRLKVLTGREREVGTALAAGLSNKEIARDLGLSPRTVEAHRAKIMKKLGISSLAEIVRLFLKYANEH